MLPAEHHARGNTSVKSFSKNPPTETFGEVFADGSMIDLVRSEAGSLRLIHWNRSRSSICYQVNKHRKTFVPPKCLDRNLLQCINFPTNACAYGSTKQLTNKLQRWFAQHPGLPEESISIFVNFVLATYFPECNEVFPCCFVCAPDSSSADLLLRLLRGVCQHSIYVTEMMEAGICALPFAIRPTLLINQARISNRFSRVLRAMSRPGVLVPRNGECRDISCPIVICSGEHLSEAALPDAVHVVLMPTRGCLPRFDGQFLRVAKELGAKLLRYRLENFKKVRKAQFDPPD